MQQRNNKKTVKPAKRWMVIMLLSCLVLTTQGMGVFAETVESVSDNSAGGADALEAVNDADTGEEEEDRDTVSENEMPSNPVHYCTSRGDGSDKSTWSYVYFGSYPKSIVNDVELKSAIDNIISEEKKQSTGEGIDVWVDGVQYRRITKSDCFAVGNFGKITNGGYLYFKWEPIKWKVLQNEGEKLFLIADKAIDGGSYHSVENQNATWKNCTLRSWLNGTFYQEAFNEEEQQAIVQQNVVNSDSGETTSDKVFILSLDELSSRIYGFCSYSHVESKSRRVKTAEYAYARGLSKNQSGNSSYWALGMNVVQEYGNLIEYLEYNKQGHSNNGIVPAIYIDLSSGLWTITEPDAEDDDDIVDDGNNTEEGGNDKDDDDEINKDSPSIQISSISLGGISKKIAAGKKISLSAEVMPQNAANKTVAWTSSNPKYATVDANGVVTMKKAGADKTVTITAAAKDGSGVYAEYKIKIMKHAVKKVKITASSKSVKAGKKLNLKAAVTTTGKNANKKLKWTSSNEGYATVSSGGVVKTSKAGKGKTVTITAMATDGSGKKAKVKIKIK